MIEVQGITKRYGAFVAVRDLSFSVGKGRVLGFIGPNGAGKTTTIKLLVGLLKPSSGTIHIDDVDIKQDPIRVKKSSATSLTDPFFITN